MELRTFLVRLVLLWIVAFAFPSILAADDCGKDTEDPEKPKITYRHATVSEAQKVWAEAQQALIDQLAERIKEEESVVNDEAATIMSVQKCVHTANAAALEARQQAKIINMLSKNSKDLIEHIDHIGQVASEEVVNDEERVAKYKEEVQDLRLRIAEAEKELVAIHECGVVKPLGRLRRHAHLPPTSVENRRLGQRFGTHESSKLRFIDRRSIEKTKASQIACKRQGEPKEALPPASEAQKVWTIAKQALVNQLEEQIQQIESAVADETAAGESAQKCVQTSIAAGLEARQQSKIVKLLSKNSKELIEHIDTIQEIATAELVGAQSSLSKFRIDLEKLRDRMTAAQKEIMEIQECGKIRVLKPLRRQSEADVTVGKANTAPNVADNGDPPLVRERRATPLEVAREARRVSRNTPMKMEYKIDAPLNLQRRGGGKSAVYSQNEMSNEEQSQFRQMIDEI